MNLKEIAALAMSEDAANAAPLTDLQKHDRRFHPNGYKEGDACKFREAMSELDGADDLTLRKGIAEAESEEEKLSDEIRAKREYKEIVSYYTNPDGTKKDGWLKAPNGQKTLLTEEQWVQVRTPSFKAWFGDWEHDPKHASKIVDRNGEPLVVYHGVGSREDAGFTEFDSESRNSGDKGVFFADLDTASWYAPEGSRIVRHYQEYDEDGNQLPLDNTDEWGNPESIYACFLNIRNPKKYNYYGKGSCQGYRGRETPGYYAENLPTRNDGMVCENIKDLGEWRDGMPGGIAREDEFWDNTVYWVRAPKQIKSATDNTGVFSPHRTSVLDEKPTQDAKPMNLKKIASLALAEDAAIVNSDKVGKWVAFPHSRNRDQVAQITKSLYDADINAPCFVYKDDLGEYIMKQDQVNAFFDSREEAKRYYEQENAKPSAISKYASSTHAEDAAAKTKHRFKAGDSVQLPIKHWTKSLPGEMGDVREVDEEKGVYLVEFDETGITDPIPFACLDEHGIKYIDGTPVEDAAPKSFDIYKDFDQNLFEWGAIREINRIRKAVAAKPKDSVVTDEEFRELNKPFHEAAKKYIADNGFSPDKKWVKETVLSVPKALANAFDTLSDGEGVSREYFLDVLTVEAVCALATKAVDSVRDIEDYYRKHKIKWDDEGYVIYRAPDFETPVTVEDASDSVDMLLTSDLHTTDLDTLDPKDARIVVIAGDIMGGGMDSDDAGREYLERKFFPWCRDHADKEIVVTAGNHDKFLFRQWVKGKKLNWPENVHYLVDKGETIGGLKFYGTPWCLKNRPGRFEGTEETLKEYFSKMPKNLDVLISHSPPYIPGEKIDDRGDGLHEGSKELTEAILDKKPRLVVCGHVHSGSRKPAMLGDSKVMNVSRVDHDRSEEAHRPHIIHFHAKKGTD